MIVEGRPSSVAYQVVLIGSDRSGGPLGLGDTVAAEVLGLGAGGAARILAVVAPGAGR